MEKEGTLPLIQRIIQVGDSRAVTIPKTWLVYYERESGQRIEEVAVEVNGKITISPILKEASKNRRNYRE
jgi:antitoxin component of MazEF toxin-antitoxin module